VGGVDDQHVLVIAEQPDVVVDLPRSAVRDALHARVTALTIEHPLYPGLGVVV
jgi:hypothetical protein